MGVLDRGRALHKSPKIASRMLLISNFSGSIASTRFLKRLEVLGRLRRIEAWCQYMVLEFKPLGYRLLRRFSF